MNRTLKVPNEKRHIFAQPLGTLIVGSREETIPQIEELLRNFPSKINVFIVGDIVTQDFLSNDFLKSYVRICIIDEKTDRKRINVNLEGIFEEIVEFQNPAGIIHKDSWLLIRNIIKSGKKTLIKITKGEEDLLVIPLVMELFIEKNVKNLIFYGQPAMTDSKHKIDEGIVLVDVKKKIKNKISKLIKLMNPLS